MYKRAVSTFVFFPKSDLFLLCLSRYFFLFHDFKSITDTLHPCAPFQSQSYCLMKKDVFDI